MVGVLISMRLRMLAHSMTGSRAAAMIVGGGAGLLLAVGTLVLAATDVAPAPVRADLLALLLACWLLGWILGPVYTGGGEDNLRPEHFSQLPLRPLRLAFGLLTAGFVGIAPIVSLIAFLSLTVYAGDHGAAGVAVCVVAVPVQLILVVVLSRLVVGLLAVVVRSRAGAILSALVNAAMAVLLNQSWVLIWAATRSDLLARGFPPRFSTVVRWLPSSWGMAAIDAAGRGDWARVAAAMAGLVVLIASALLIWARLLVRRTTTRPALWVPRGGGSSLLDRLADRSLVGTVAAKEVRTWSRDLMRTHLFLYSLFFGVLYTLVPLVVDWRGMLPWAGLIVVSMAAATSANLFGLDGTALWLGLVNPGGERAEIRGRQLAWLLQVAPVTVLITLAGLIAGGTAEIWPWALALLAAALGGGAGLVVLVSVYALAPVIEPNRRSSNPLEAGPDFGRVILVLLLVTLTAAPAAVVAWIGTRFDRPVVAWLAVAVGLATGAGLTVWGGRQAQRRLRETGPELLSAMRGGTVVTLGRGKVGPAVTLPRGRRALVGVLWTFCWIPLFPQGLIPLGMIIAGSDAKVWFAALYATDPWRIPIAVAFIVLGLVMLYFGAVIPRRYERRPPPAGATETSLDDEGAASRSQ